MVTLRVFVALSLSWFMITVPAAEGKIGGIEALDRSFNRMLSPDLTVQQKQFIATSMVSTVATGMMAITTDMFSENLPLPPQVLHGTAIPVNVRADRDIVIKKNIPIQVVHVFGIDRRAHATGDYNALCATIFTVAALVEINIDYLMADVANLSALKDLPRHLWACRELGKRAMVVKTESLRLGRFSYGLFNDACRSLGEVDVLRISERYGQLTRLYSQLESDFRLPYNARKGPHLPTDTRSESFPGPVFSIGEALKQANTQLEARRVPVMPPRPPALVLPSARRGMGVDAAAVGVGPRFARENKKEDIVVDAYAADMPDAAMPEGPVASLSLQAMVARIKPAQTFSQRDGSFRVRPHGAMTHQFFMEGWEDLHSSYFYQSGEGADKRQRYNCFSAADSADHNFPPFPGVFLRDGSIMSISSTQVSFDSREEGQEPKNYSFGKGMDVRLSDGQGQIVIMNPGYTDSTNPFFTVNAQTKDKSFALSYYVRPLFPETEKKDTFANDEFINIKVSDLGKEPQYLAISLKNRMYLVSRRHREDMSSISRIFPSRTFPPGSHILDMAFSPKEDYIFVLWMRGSQAWIALLRTLIDSIRLPTDAERKASQHSDLIELSGYPEAVNLPNPPAGISIRNTARLACYDGLLAVAYTGYYLNPIKEGAEGQRRWEAPVATYTLGEEFLK